MPRSLQHVLKAAMTAAVFYLLLTHPIALDGERISVLQAVLARGRLLSWRHMAPFLALAAATKAVGIACSIARWQLLLAAQGLRQPLGEVIRTFLIGRFLGTFLPGTLGLDGYKLFDAARRGGDTTGPLAATLIEKFTGLCGILLTFLVAAPWGYRVLGEAARPTLWLCVPLALGGCATVLLVLLRPDPLARAARALRRRLPAARLPALLLRLAVAAGALRGRSGLVCGVFALSLAVHGCTAALYYFTALAVGAMQARLGEVVFASSIQILATVLSPLTLAGEGVREAVHALLLARQLGLSESILSAALGFWAAEALTLVGAYFWWRRGPVRGSGAEGGGDQPAGQRHVQLAGVRLEQAAEHPPG